MVPGWRIAGMAAILGLLGSGVAGAALSGGRMGSSLLKRSSLGSRLMPPGSEPKAANGLGLRLLQQAATAWQGTPYRGEQAVWWWGQGRKPSVVEVWHQPGAATLVQASGAAPRVSGAAPRASGAAPQAQGDGAAGRYGAAGEPDPDGILVLSAQFVALLRPNYQVDYAGRGSAAGRAALVVEVRRPGGGLAARFWLDAATKLPLRREIFANGARVISKDAFITLDLGHRGLADMPAPAAAPWAARLDQARLAALRAGGWPLPGQLPGNLMLFAASQTSARSGKVVDLSYSDGLAVVSLFVQRGELGRRRPGWRQFAMGRQTVYLVDPADRSFAWSSNGFVYTMVADAPVATVSQVVTALPGPPGLGFWQRMGRGFRRLASFLNPLRRLWSSVRAIASGSGACMPATAAAARIRLQAVSGEARDVGRGWAPGCARLVRLVPGPGLPNALVCVVPRGARVRATAALRGRRPPAARADPSKALPDSADHSVGGGAYRGAGRRIHRRQVHGRNASKLQPGKRAPGADQTAAGLGRRHSGPGAPRRGHDQG